MRWTARTAHTEQQSQEPDGEYFTEGNEGNEEDEGIEHEDEDDDEEKD